MARITNPRPDCQTKPLPARYYGREMNAVRRTARNPAFPGRGRGSSIHRAAGAAAAGARGALRGARDVTRVRRGVAAVDARGRGRAARLALRIGRARGHALAAAAARRGAARNVARRRRGIHPTRAGWIVAAAPVFAPASAFTAVAWLVTKLRPIAGRAGAEADSEERKDDQGDAGVFHEFVMRD